MSTSFQQLPYEVIIEIGSYLGPIDTIAFRNTCRVVKDLIPPHPHEKYLIPDARCSQERLWHGYCVCAWDHLPMFSSSCYAYYDNCYDEEEIYSDLEDRAPNFCKHFIGGPRAEHDEAESPPSEQLCLYNVSPLETKQIQYVDGALEIYNLEFTSKYDPKGLQRDTNDWLGKCILCNSVIQFSMNHDLFMFHGVRLRSDFQRTSELRVSCCPDICAFCVRWRPIRWHGRIKPTRVFKGSRVDRELSYWVGIKSNDAEVVGSDMVKYYDLDSDIPSDDDI